MAYSENIVNIKKISDKYNLSLIFRFNPNLLYCELCGFLGGALFASLHN